MTLRARVIAAIGVIALVLLAALVVLTRTTEANLVRQVDDQLAAAVQPVRDVDTDLGLGPERGPGGRPDLLDRRLSPAGRSLSSLYVGVVRGVGTVRSDRVTTVVAPGLRGDEVPLPVIDASQAVVAAGTGRPFTVRSSEGDLRYRIRAYPSGDDGPVVVLGLPLDTVDDTVDDLVALAVTGAAAVLVALALVAFWVIRLGVRPVKQMTETATAIAAGDLSRRVPDTDPRTEAGELGQALNQMLTSIEGSFAERRAVEDRLRRFVADASHELRTPLATIRGYAELHRAGALPAGEALDDAMRRTEQESIRMGGLVDDLLQLARLDQRRPLDDGTVDLVQVVEDAAADARATDPDRAVRTVTTAPVVVRGDEARIRQVVANLVGNALAHTPSSSALTLVASLEHDVGVVEVADEGPGMTEEVAARAFERFYRADPSRSRHRGGSGLGLAIVEATVGAHGGRASLRSSPAEGTTVRVELPTGPPAA